MKITYSSLYIFSKNDAWYVVSLIFQEKVFYDVVV